MSELESEIKYLKGVGPKRAELLEKELGIHDLNDLIHLYPFRYIDRTSIQRIADIRQDGERRQRPDGDGLFQGSQMELRETRAGSHFHLFRKAVGI